MTILRNNHHYFVDEMKKKVFAVNQKQTWPPVSLNSDLNCINKWGLYSFQPTRAKGYYTCKWFISTKEPVESPPVKIRAVEPDFKKSNKKSDAQGACRRLYLTFASKGCC